MKLVVNLIVYVSKIIKMNFYNFYKCWSVDTFLSITKIDVPLKVPHLLALGHIETEYILLLYDILDNDILI